jgi:hypothetical protein
LPRGCISVERRQVGGRSRTFFLLGGRDVDYRTIDRTLAAAPAAAPLMRRTKVLEWAGAASAVGGLVTAVGGGGLAGFLDRSSGTAPLVIGFAGFLGGIATFIGLSEREDAAYRDAIEAFNRDSRGRPECHD